MMMSLSDLRDKPTFAELKRFSRQQTKPGQEFLDALERFGHEPDDSWTALEADLKQNVERLTAASKIFDTRTSLPAAELRQVTHEIRQAVERIEDLVRKIRYQIQTGVQPNGFSKASNPVAEKAWEKYDDVIRNTGLSMFNRRLVQALLNRAHEPASAVGLLFSDDVRGKVREFFDLMPAFADIARHTPLNRLKGKTLAERESEFRRSMIEGVRSGVKTADLPVPFEKLVAMLEGSTAEKKEAHRMLEHMRNKHIDEIWGRLPSSDWAHYRQLLAIWDGVKAALDHPDPIYRRGALAVLPKLSFTFVLGDVLDEVLPFIVKGLRDSHGHIRFKIVRFVDTLYPQYFDERRKELDAFEQSVRESRKEFRRGSPERKSHEQVLAIIKETKDHRAYFALTEQYPDLVDG